MQLSTLSCDKKRPSAMSDNLRDEQRFLMRSLHDLDREREAGDITDEDYGALRDDYVARLAALTRRLNGVEIEEAASAADMVRRSWTRRLLVGVSVLSIGIGAGLFVARQSGQRLPGETFTGGIEQSTANLLATARTLNFTDPGKAIETYSEVLKLEPDNVEALTYRSWLLALTARDAEGSIKQLALATAVADLLRAQSIDGTYPDAHCFLGIVYFRFLEQPELAKPRIDECERLNPPAEVKAFVGAISDEVDAALEK